MTINKNNKLNVKANLTLSNKLGDANRTGGVTGNFDFNRTSANFSTSLRNQPHANFLQT
jgi:hypothetical protein